MSTACCVGLLSLGAAVWAAAQIVSSAKVFHLLNLSFSLETKTLWPPSLALRWKPKLCRVKCPFLLQDHAWRSQSPQGSSLTGAYSRILWADKHCFVLRLTMVLVAGSQLHCCCWECTLQSVRLMLLVSWWEVWMHFSSRVFLMRKPCSPATVVQSEHGLVLCMSEANASSGHQTLWTPRGREDATYQSFPG